MKLLLVNQYFWPDWAATAQLLGDLGAAAAAEGFRVTALAGRGVYAAPDGTKLASVESWNGVAIRRVPCTSFGRGKLQGRISDYLTFLLSSAAWMLTRERFDVVVCLSTPPLIAILGMIAKSRGAKFIYKVEDLYPDLAIELGVLKPKSTLTRILSGISSRLLQSADVCVALDEAMGDVLKKRSALEVEVIPNWAAGDAIASNPESGRAFRAEHEIPETLMVLYSGNLGNAHRFDAVCEAVHLLDSRGAEVQFLFVGAGPRLEEVKTALREVSTVRFMPYQPREKLGELYNAADIHLVTLKDEVSGMLVPSKIAGALAAGKPVLLVGGEGTDLFSEINNQGVGWALQHDVAEIVRVISKAVGDPTDLAARGLRARQLFDRKYSKKEAMTRWLALLNDVATRCD